MPRKPRLHQPDLPLHLINRGVEKRDIFRDDGDRRFYMKCVADAFEQFFVRLFSYCLMSNHSHLLAAPTTVPIGVPMHLVQTRYAHYYNHRYERVGHLFQNRFISVPVLDLRQFVNVAVYVNENPPRAGLVSRTEDWMWSSHHEIVSGGEGILDLDGLRDIVGLERDDFVQFYRDRIDRGEERRRIMRLDELIEEAAGLVGLTPVQLGSGGRGQSFSIGRRLVRKWGTAAGFSMSEMAEALGCSLPALHQLD